MSISIDKIKNIAVLITAVVGASGVIYGTFSTIDGRYALAKDVKVLDKRLTTAELKDLLRKALENKYFYRDQVRKYPNDIDLKTKLEEAEEEVKGIKQQLKDLVKEE